MDKPIQSLKYEDADTKERNQIQRDTIKERDILCNIYYECMKQSNYDPTKCDYIINIAKQYNNNNTTTK